MVLECYSLLQDTGCSTNRSSSSNLSPDKGIACYLLLFVISLQLSKPGDQGAQEQQHGTAAPTQPHHKSHNWMLYCLQILMKSAFGAVAYQFDLRVTQEAAYLLLLCKAFELVLGKCLSTGAGRLALGHFTDYYLLLRVLRCRVYVLKNFYGPQNHWFCPALAVSTGFKVWGLSAAGWASAGNQDQSEELKHHFL